jgi:phosphoglycolate phosphatase
MSGRGGAKAVIFDLDGTLVDSAADIAVALNAAFAPLGVAAFDHGDVKAMIGAGSAVLVERAAAAAGLPMDAAGRAAILDRFMEVYKVVSAEGRGLYPGAIETLDVLKRDGWRLALCTNKPAAVTMIAVKALGLSPYFDTVVGARDDLAKKPAPDMIAACLVPHGIAPAEAVMVGDSAADHGAARAAGTAVVLVDFGYSKVPVASLAPDAVVSALSDIPPLVPLLARV